MLAQQAQQQRDFLAARGFIKLLLDSGQFVHAVDFNVLGVALNAATDGSDGFRPGGGKQQRLALRRRMTDHIVNGIAKAHIKHAIGFIQHQGFECFQRHGALFQMIEQTPRRGDDDMRSML